MVRRWFCSDWHLFHTNILGFSDMPFKTIEEHDEALVTLHNERVKPEDHFYMLGDATLIRGSKSNQERFINYAKKFNGHGRIFLGNHDHFDAKVYLEAGFEKILATWRDEQGIIYSHFPLHPSTLSSVRANVHGHIHTHDSPPPAVHIYKSGYRSIAPYINVCMEKINYAPIDFDELSTKIEEARAKFEKENPEPEPDINLDPSGGTNVPS